LYKHLTVEAKFSMSAVCAIITMAAVLSDGL